VLLHWFMGVVHLGLKLARLLGIDISLDLARQSRIVVGMRGCLRRRWVGASRRQRGWPRFCRRCPASTASTRSSSRSSTSPINAILALLKRERQAHALLLVGRSLTRGFRVEFSLELQRDRGIRGFVSHASATTTAASTVKCCCCCATLHAFQVKHTLELCCDGGIRGRVGSISRSSVVRDVRVHGRGASTLAFSFSIAMKARRQHSVCRRWVVVRTTSHRRSIRR